MNSKHLGSALLLSLALLVPTLSRAEFRQYYPLNGVPVRQGYHVEWFRSGAVDENGNLCVVWSDTRLGDRDLWAQLISPTGELLWGEQGTLIASTINRQEDPHVMPDGQGNWIFTWADFRDDPQVLDLSDIYIQKVDSEGNLLWSPDTGVPISTDPAKQLWVQSFPDGAGGAVSIWVDVRNGNEDLYGSRMDADGNQLWGEGGIPLAWGDGKQGSLGGGNYTADTDGAGGIIFAWQDNRNPNNLNLYANRVDVNGDLVWADSSGMPICLTPMDQSGVRLTPDGNGGAFLVWKDSRFEALGDLYGQHVSSDGTTSWSTDGVVICDATGGQEKVRIVDSAEGEAILVWNDKRNDFVYTDLFVQRISLGAGAPVLHWGDAGSETDGLELVALVNNQHKARLYPDGTGGAVISWVDERFGEAPNDDLYAQRIHQDGTFDWGPDGNGQPVSLAPYQQDGNLTRVFAGNAAVIWLDYRLGSPGLYYQVFDLDGTAQLPENGSQIVYGLDNSATRPTIQRVTDTEYIFTWLDGRLGGDLGTYTFAQKVDVTTGELLWQENGINITPGLPSETLTGDAQDLAVISDGADGIIAIWEDGTRNPSFQPQLFAQHLANDGTAQWGDTGVPVGYDAASGLTDQFNPFAFPTDDGGAMVVYGQMNSIFVQYVYAQRLDSNGDYQWTSGDGYPGIQVSTVEGDHILEDVVQFSDGSLLAVYIRNNDVFAQRILTDGTLAWANELVICDATGIQQNVAGTTVNGEVVVAWEDQRRGSPILDIHAQRISPDGTIHWAEDGAALVAAENQQADMVLATFTDTDTEFWMAWKDAADGLEDIRVQRFDMSGAAQLAAGGVAVGTDDARQFEPRMIVDADNGVYLTWEESTGEAIFSDLQYAHLDENGDFADPAYGGTGIPLSEAYHRQTDLVMVDDGLGGAITVWRDFRSSGKEDMYNIYMQTINDHSVGVRREPVQLAGNWELEPAFPNPFNPSTTVRYTVPRTARASVFVYDLLGRKVATLAEGVHAAGSYRVSWDGRNQAGRSVASGTYILRLEAAGADLARRAVLMK